MRYKRTCLAALLLFCSRMLQANELFQFFGGGAPEKAKIEQHVQHAFDTDGSPAITDQQLRAQFTLVSDSTRTWSIQQRAAHFHTSEAVTVPGAALAVPQTLWAVETGAAYNRKLEEGRRVGVRFGIGSASDELFYSRHEVALGFTTYYRVPSARRNAWFAFLNYSNNRHFLNNVPLPGFAYYAESISKKWRTVVGFPFLAVMYAPAPACDMSFSVFGPRRMGADAGVRFGKSVRVFTAFEWGALEWFRACREDPDKRLFFDRKRISLGAKTPFGEKVEVETSVGREFDRRFFENDSSSHDGVPSLKLDAAWFGSLKISLHL